MAKIEVGSCSSWFLVHKILPPWISEAIYQSPAAGVWLQRCATSPCILVSMYVVCCSQEQSYNTHGSTSLMSLTYYISWCLMSCSNGIPRYHGCHLLACRYHWCQWQYLCTVTQYHVYSRVHCHKVSSLRTRHPSSLLPPAGAHSRLVILIDLRWKIF